MKPPLMNVAFVWACFLSVAVMSLSTPAAENILRLKLRSREKNSERLTEKVVEWKAAETALIICDMWDDHWCKSAARRVVEMAGPLDETVKAARHQGVFIIHAPSTCVDYYKNSPQRMRAIEAPYKATPVPIKPTPRWGTYWCWTDPMRESVLPIDDSDMGCDCEIKCEIRAPWKRQIDRIEIEKQDAISDNGQEVWNLLMQRGIKHVILCGVHLNMCVLGRPFGIRQMTYFGLDVALMRDMTDTMYNPERPPGVSHFKGTELMIEHVERYWCPTFVSTDITGKKEFKFVGPR